MLREAQIPLALWLPAALLAHLFSGGGAHEAASAISESAAMVAFARQVRSDVRRSLEATSIELIDDGAQPAEPEEDDDSGEAKADEEEESTDKTKPPEPPEAKPEPEKQQPPSKRAPPKPLEPKKEITRPLLPLKPTDPKPAAPKPAAPRPEDKGPKPEPIAKPEEPKPAEEKKAEKEKKNETQKLELPKPEGRIAVINDPTTDKNQQDNPNADRIADHAKKVDEETMARFRSYDQNTSKPTGGGQPEEADPTLEEPGNAREDVRGFSQDSQEPGDPRPGSEKGPDDPSRVAIARSPTGNNAEIPGQKATPGQKGVKGLEAGKGERMPETVATPGGGWTISPDGGDGRAAQKGRKGHKAILGTPYVPGIPKPGALPQKYSINAYGLMEALGREHLRKEQEKARSTRISKHRGKFKGSQFDKYRAAIENYDPSVKAGNQTSLNAARVPFASYINMMHNRIHPIFADGFLGSLTGLPGDDKLSNIKLVSHVEMVLDGQSGEVVRAGIVKGSGVTAFDVGALSSLHAASPFGQAPEMIVSPDGKVYVHWEFYRDPYYACTSKFARPYIIQGPKKDKNDGPAPTPPPRPRGEGERYGRR